MIHSIVRMVLPAERLSAVTGILGAMADLHTWVSCPIRVH
jgi:hypothetical protein